MALTFARLQELIKNEGLSFYLAPDRPAVRLGMKGLHANLQAEIRVELDEQFLQLRAIGYLSCPPDHANLGAVLRVLASLNYRTRFVKYAWDPADGEITAYGDAWVMDGTITQQQFNRMCGNFFPAIDMVYPRIKAAMETGKDPGEADPASLLAAAMGSLPPELRDLLEDLRSGRGARPPAGRPKSPAEISEI